MAGGEGEGGVDGEVEVEGEHDGGCLHEWGGVYSYQTYVKEIC